MRWPGNEKPLSERHSVDTARLTDAIVKRLPAPADGNAITYDADVKGFGARVTAAGNRAFVLGYRTRAGRQRRYTIGSFPDWQTTAAREEARRLKRLIDAGGDPLGEIAAERGAATVDDLIERFLEEHVSRKRPHTQVGYRVAIERYIRPALGRMKVTAVDWGDLDALHRKITKAGHTTQANRVAAAASKMFALAIKWRMRADNPAKGIERNSEQRRKRYLSAAELKRLTDALDDARRPAGRRYLLLVHVDRLPCRRGHGGALGRYRLVRRQVDQARKYDQAEDRPRGATERRSQASARRAAAADQRAVGVSRR